MNRSVLNAAASLKFALFVAIAMAVWLGLSRMGDNVGWLKVEAPRTAIAGKSLPIRVYVRELKESTRLCVDLHWSSNHDSSNEFLASGGSTPIGGDGGSFDFEIMVRPMHEIRYVRGIIYLSPTGNWDDHTFVAATDLIPVSTNRNGGNSTLAQLSVHRQEESFQQERARPSPALSWATGILLLTASVVAWMNSRSAPGTRKTSDIAHRQWLVFAMGLALGGAWELLGLENQVGSLARAWARAEDVYYSREWFQRMSVSAILAAAIMMLGVVWRKRWPCRSALIFFGLYLVISSLNMLSLHALDRYAGISWHGISAVGSLKFLSGAAVLAGVVFARRAARSTTAE